MFTNVVDKKLLGIIAAFLVLLILGGAFFYIYLTRVKTQVTNVNNGADIQNQQNEVNSKDSGIEFDAKVQSGILVCVDKCGDGICQAGEENCSNLNCVCREDKQECPQDCK